MHRTQIYLHDELYQQLKLRSQRQGLSISELIRRAVEKDLHTEPADDARTFFDQAAPLQSFAEVEPESYVRELRSQSRLLREAYDSDV